MCIHDQLLNIPKGRQKVYNSEKLATYGKQNEEKQTKIQHNMGWTPLCANKHKDVNYTSSLLQTTGGQQF